MDFDDFNLLKKETADLVSRELSDREMDLFLTYAQEMVSWNDRASLTAIRDHSEIRVKHFLDSISCLKAKPNGRVIDVGSGAGFPGLVLKILMPNIELSLVDSVQKKTQFLTHMVQVLGLENVSVLNTRAEELGQDPGHREQYDWAVARALANFPVLLEYLLPLVKIGGYVLAQKGEGPEDELKIAENALEELGGEIKEIIPVEIPGLKERSLVIVKKVSETPKKYPRHTGVPKKRPL